MKQEKSYNNPPGGGYQKALVNVKDALYSLMMEYPTEEWVKLPSPGLMVFETSNQEVKQNESINNSVRKVDTSIIHVGDAILDTAAEAGIDENYYLLNNQSTCSAFINKKYLTKIRDAPDGQYIRLHCNSGVTYTNKIGEPPGYYDPVWYNPKGIDNILSLDLVQKNHPVTYNG